jgi:cytidine deaminase
MDELPLNKIDGSWDTLLEAARQVRGAAYCPYSKFEVGSALLCENGEIVSGANVENAAFGSTICAERSALVRANAMGLRVFSRLVVSVRGKPAAPCGSCRQMLHEFASHSGGEIKILLHGEGYTRVRLTSIAELLPYGFELR